MNADLLADRFEGERPRLHGVAYRLLGSASEADDAVQETWLRLSRSDTSGVENLSGWLTTVAGRVCLDMLRSRRSRREQPLAHDGDSIPDGADPEREAVQAESVGLAMVAVLERLGPAERVAFVLHDVFGVSFEEIAEIVGRTPTAARQLASRARRRVQGSPVHNRAADLAGHRHVVEAFFKASRAGDLQALLAVLAPDASLRADAAAMQMGARSGWLRGELRGAEAVARQFAGQAQAAQIALIDGVAGAVWATAGRLRVVFEFTVRDGKITEIALAADPDRLQRVNVEITGAQGGDLP